MKVLFMYCKLQMMSTMQNLEDMVRICGSGIITYTEIL
jgi:hypothetical protein